MRRFLWISVCVLLLSGLGLGQALSRVFGKVSDTAGQPLAGVKITVIMKDQATWKKEIETNAKGDYEISFTDGTKIYLFQMTKGDYLLLNDEKRALPNNTEEVKPTIFTSAEKNFVMSSKAELEKKAREEEIKKNPHLAFFEEGRKAYLAGDLAAARKAFEACLKAKPDYTKVNVFLADIDLKEGKTDDAIAKAEASMNGSDEEKAVALRILISANQKKGKKDKVADYQKQLDALQPESAESLFNKAAELLNKKDDAGAKPLLEKAVEINPDFAAAYYQLGYLYYHLQDTPACKKAFEKFLQLQPEGKEAEEVKDFLKWL